MSPATTPPKSAPDQLTELRGRVEALERSGPDDRWVAASAVPARFAISHRTFERWLRNPTMGFPQPFRVNGRRFFSDAKLRRFKAKREAQSAKES